MIVTEKLCNEAKYNLGKVKTKPMQQPGILEGLEGSLQGHCHVLWLELLCHLPASFHSWCRDAVVRALTSHQ